MKRVAIIVVLAVFVFQSISSFLILTSFLVNKDYISKNLCINRFDELSLCKGQCYLVKKLNDNDQKQQLPDVKQKEVQPFTLNDFSVNLIPYHDLPFQKRIPNHKGFILTGYTSLVFHPPTLIETNFV